MVTGAGRVTSQQLNKRYYLPGLCSGSLGVLWSGGCMFVVVRTL
jgi:hypothetical protein